jgi:hypothetical protein
MSYLNRILNWNLSLKFVRTKIIASNAIYEWMHAGFEFWKKNLEMLQSLSSASMLRHHMSCTTWLWCILCNSYAVDLYFIGWSMRCDMLLCSWCMSRCILLSRSLLLVLIQHVCESARGGWCVLDGVTR